MAVDEKLADRVREIIAVTHKKVEEKRMFGGLCFMVNNKMCVCTREGRIMVRVDPDDFDELIEKENCEPMNFTGKTMHGFVYVNESVLRTKKQLDYWVQLGLAFNKTVKSSPKTAVKKKTKH
ncbi:MAG TPA: TfoX/Sxy family protein [Chitinophagaceae bacterium]|jgi:TfoX/Sxy family transcriptional regulator of competence genes|nr:TfoX/Sxy family protein [Chitinophagaceae bacterium]